MNTSFDLDPYPGRPKILFIGLGSSSHTCAWIDLLDNSEFNVRLFSVPAGGMPPADWKVRAYTCEPSSQLPVGLDRNIRQSLFPLPEDIHLFDIWFEKNPIPRILRRLTGALNGIGTRFGMPPIYYDTSHYYIPRESKTRIPGSASPDEWLAQIIQDWQPDIIHTLGLFDGQGGEFFYAIRNKYGLEKIGTWVLQLRGGSDLALRRHDPQKASQIREIFESCDQIVTDNRANIDYLEQLDFGHKIASISPVPGTGGIDVKSLMKSWENKTSRRHIVVFPKAYELPWSKALPVFEALKIAMGSLAESPIHILNITPEIRDWYNTLPESLRRNCFIHSRIPRAEFFSLLAKARVLLIPSLVDGIPNSLYEAMVLGAFPIVSPLETIASIVENEKNVLFARNLYPHEIAEALIRAMNDDALVDKAAQNNAILVEKIADRATIQERVTKYYQKLAEDRGLCRILSL